MGVVVGLNDGLVHLLLLVFSSERSGGTPNCAKGRSPLIISPPNVSTLSQGSLNPAPPLCLPGRRKRPPIFRLGGPCFWQTSSVPYFCFPLWICFFHFISTLKQTFLPFRKWEKCLSPMRPRGSPARAPFGFTVKRPHFAKIESGSLSIFRSTFPR